ncbi:MAG: hypothetical protein ACK456_11910 [Pseudanabaenaceae cyanobacterium]|jgi:hypothetical protein
MIYRDLGFRLTAAIAIGATALGSPAFAIENGLYYGGRSFYIRIASQGDRVCYQGMSARGVTVASMELLKKQSDRRTYVIYNFRKLGVSETQQEPRQIRFGEVDKNNNVVLGSLYNLVETEESLETSPEMNQCLNSEQPFFWQNLSPRDRR